MYGAMIGDIIGSRYEFDNIKTKNFPLFSKGCDFTDDTIMTVAMAKAILRSREEQYKNGTQSFQSILIEEMQALGRQYPNPTGAYGGNFAQWLNKPEPKPYGSFGNGSAMRTSPCGLAAVTLEEAIALARAGAAVSHNHPEGIKGAEAVSTAIFLAKTGRTKEEIRRYVEEHYYPLNFTLDAIRPSYSFDGSCQGSVPQAIVAFLESESFEDAIRNVISIGGDCDTTGAITGSIAYTYYIIQDNGWWPGWVENKPSPDQQAILTQAKAYLPQEFIAVADAFREVCWQRAGTHERVGGCTPILTKAEWERFRPAALTAEEDIKITEFCKKYVVLAETLFRDRELNQWCRNYSAYSRPAAHLELEKIIYDGLMKEAYELGIMPKLAHKKDTAQSGSRLAIACALFEEIRGDYATNGSLIYRSLGEGTLYKQMTDFLNR